MVYMIGDQSLNNSGFADLKEMKKIGSTSEVAIIAQFSRGVKNRPTKRYHFRKNNRNSPLSADVVEDLGMTNSADPKALEDFIRWGGEKFPARHYLLVMWGHGNGADDENVPNASNNPLLLEEGVSNPDVKRRAAPRATARSIGITQSDSIFDGVAVDFLDTCKFKKALQSAKEVLGREIDILGMDSCLMSGAEICYQARNSARLTVAPEWVGPADGWPYDKILDELVKKPTMRPIDLARNIMGEYLASYADYEDISVTQAICDLSKSDMLARAVDRLAGALLKHLSIEKARKAIMLSRWQAQSYDGTSYVDLYDFCNLLQSNCQQKAIKIACQEVMKAIRPKGFVIKSVYQGQDAQYSYGLSIYFPLDEVSRFYERLDFANETRWVAFLKEYVSKTRRPDRRKKDTASI
jgi:hypothetical protein